jgi:hypothetical protein
MDIVHHDRPGLDVRHFTAAACEWDTHPLASAQSFADVFRQHAV